MYRTMRRKSKRASLIGRTLGRWDKKYTKKTATLIHDAVVRCFWVTRARLRSRDEMLNIKIARSVYYSHVHARVTLANLPRPPPPPPHMGVW